MSVLEERNGGPAYPTEFGVDVNGTPQRHTGMSLRDYFAGQALAGMLGNPDYPDGSFWAQLAEDAYDVADAMLETRKASK